MTETQKQLVTQNHNLIFSFLQKYHLEFDDYYDLAAIGLCQAATTFDSNKSQFSTFAYRCMYGSVFTEIRKCSSINRIPSDQILYYETETQNEEGDCCSIINFIPSKENLEENVLSEIIFNEYTNKLKERDKLVFILFKQGYKQQEIGDIVGCSQKNISLIKHKLIQYLAG